MAFGIAVYNVEKEEKGKNGSNGNSNNLNRRKTKARNAPAACFHDKGNKNAKQRKKGE